MYNRKIHYLQFKNKNSNTYFSGSERNEKYIDLTMMCIFCLFGVPTQFRVKVRRFARIFNFMGELSGSKLNVVGAFTGRLFFEIFFD